MGLSIFVLIKRLRISWFLRLRFCGHSRNLEFTITIVAGHRQVVSARAVKISFYIILLLPLLTARAAARAKVFLLGHLPWCGTGCLSVCLPSSLSVCMYVSPVMKPAFAL